jgi:diguanylate cyclase (GGDEF)-like protein
MDRLQVTIEQGVRHGYLNALLFLDVDYFKHINDSLGHLVGDKFLQEISKRLIESIRTEDTVARLGGDEFVILLNNLPSDRKKASEQAYSVAKKLSDILNRSYEIESHDINTGVSIGIYIFSYEKEDPNDVLRCADAAMYHAKDNGRNRIEFYVPEIDRNLKEFMETEKEMRRALEENQFELYYQPQAVLSSDVVDRLEALIRWNHPQKGLVEPMNFIPIAEKSGLILKLGEWVIEESAKQMRIWLDKYDDFPIRRIAINISPIQFLQQSFIKNFMAVIRKYRLEPENFELELTENVILKDIQNASGKNAALEEMGVTVALDDFGTGYSSLSYLQQLPVSVIKIDRSFITNLEKDKNNEMIVKTILSVAKNFNLHVVAEGVETQGEYDFLSKMDFDHYQGFYCEKALPKKELEQFLSSHSKRSSMGGTSS